MSVQDFLAVQKASFVPVHTLLWEIQTVNRCTLKEAAQALSICLHQAGDGGPKWHKFDDATGAVEMTDLKSVRDASSMLRLLAEDALGHFSGPAGTITSLNGFPEEGRGRAVKVLISAGFRRCDIYPLLATSPNKLLPAAADDSIPRLGIRHNPREKVVAWVAALARVLLAVGDTTESLARKIVDEVPTGVLSEKGPITVASVVRMLPRGITGGRAKNGRRSSQR
jgi:hypothetical protein